MRRNILFASLLVAILANVVVFGALSTTALGKPTPRPTRTVVVKTFTPNPELLRRRVTVTPTITPTPTRYPTSAFPTETRVPPNQRGE